MFSHRAAMTRDAPGSSAFLGLIQAMFQTDGRGRLMGEAPYFYLLVSGRHLPVSS
jgi:hypothetical protein